MKVNDKSAFQPYHANNDRYVEGVFRPCGHSGIRLPAISLGLWHNFGSVDSFFNAQNIARAAFDLGITHFDLANNYGPSYGSAETNFGKIMAQDFRPHRDELFIASKAGYDMWPGPYGRGGSRKYLISSLEQSLKRMQIEYVDLFYHHCPDPNTPLEETMRALDQIVRSGKALYIGISNYKPEQAREAMAILKSLGTPCLIQQSRYSMLERGVEDALLGVLEENGAGFIAFSPLAQGMLTDRYLNEIPSNSRAAKTLSYLNSEQVEQNLPKIHALNGIAQERGQKLSQLAIAWLLRDERVSSVLIGASSPEQLKDNVAALSCAAFSREELIQIDDAL